MLNFFKNFIIRGSSGGTWALSLKFNKEVQHFLILRKGSALLLEDSSLHFSSLLSLLTHYSTICEELPCLLRLPSTLALADSLQALDSFSLLGKDFWKYPMAKFSRRSLLLSEDRDRGTRSCERNSERREGEKDGDQVRREPGDEIKGSVDLAALSARLSQQLEELSKFVSRLVGVRRIGSQQVDSSSWEFLSAAESSTNTTPTSTHRSNTSSTPVHKITGNSSYMSTVVHCESTSPAKRRDSLMIREESRSPTPVIGKSRKQLGGSKDSVYESEYDSSTGSSLTSQDSAFCPSIHSSRQLGQNRALPELSQ